MEEKLKGKIMKGGWGGGEEVGGIIVCLFIFILYFSFMSPLSRDRKEDRGKRREGR